MAVPAAPRRDSVLAMDAALSGLPIRPRRTGPPRRTGEARQLGQTSQTGRNTPANTCGQAPTGDAAVALAWRPGRYPVVFDEPGLSGCARQIREPVHLLAVPGRGLGVGLGGAVVAAPAPGGPSATVDADGAGAPVVGLLPPLYPEWLGDRSFGAAHGVRFPYIAGEMATGIASTELVTAMARARMLAFFGSGGLPPARIEQAAAVLSRDLAGMPNWGINLLHSPGDARLENGTAELLLRHGVPCVSASAFMTLTPAVVRCAASGLRRAPDGRIIRRTRVFAKISRPEVAELFMSPPPAPILRALVEHGQLTADEAELAAGLPVAEDITVEADSAGHTDGRPLAVLLPAVQAARDAVVERYGLTGRSRIRIGAAGGLGTPQGVAGAFALGAAYVLTGSVNQVSVESGQSWAAKEMLAGADLADVAMAPAADMFELGAKVQVLRRGTMFASRAGLLYEAYRRHDSVEQIPEAARTRLERDVFGMPLAEVWRRATEYWQARDPAQVRRADENPKHRMALLFRWYLGNSGRWALAGDSARRTDYQIWCGPAMGAFNRWVAGSFLADPAHRGVVQIALNLLEGAAVAARVQQLRSHGLPIAASRFPPRRLAPVPD